MADRQYELVEGWGELPRGWQWGQVAGVACDSEDRVHVYTRTEHPYMIFDRSGCMVKDSSAPKKSSATEPANGSVQLPVLSMITPNTHGETMAASAEPEFMMPLAVPEKFGDESTRQLSLF